MDRATRRLAGSLLTTSSAVALLFGSAAPAVASACYTGPFVGGFTNAGATSCIAAQNTSFTGNLVNSGTVSPGDPTGIFVNNTTITGKISNSGAIVAGPGIVVSGGSTITLGITSSGTISGSGVGLSIDATSVVDGTVSLTGLTFIGGVSNGGTISGGSSAGLVVNGGNTFGGGIANTGAITATRSTLQISNLGTFSGGILNAGGGTITSTNSSRTTIVIDSVQNFAGGISNAGTISANPASTAISVRTVSTFSGGITNSGGITSGGVAVLINGVSVFSSGISNSGTISSSDRAISLRNIGSFAGIANSNLIKGAVGISIGSGVTFAAEASITNSGTIQGTGGTAIDLHLATAPVTIAQNGGTIIGQILFSPNGDTLTGHGSITGNIVTGNATIAPTLGGSGALAITGNFTQGPSGTTVVEVNPTTASKLTVSGTASLGGALKIVYDPGTYSAQTYDIVHAGTVAGTYATVSGTAPSGLNQSVGYTGTDVDLALTAPASDTTPPSSPVVISTNTAVLGDLPSIALGNFAGAQGAVFDHLDNGDTGNDGAGSAAAAAAPAKIAMNGALGRVAQLGASMPDMLAHYGGWVRGIGNFQSADTQGAVTGYSASGGGFLAGIDHAFGPLTAGIAAGYSGIGFKQKDGSSGDVQTPRVLAYARYRAAPQIIVDGLAGFAYDSIHTTRPVAALGANAIENHGATEENLALQAGYVTAWNGITLIPRLGAQYVHLAQHGFSESGASGFDLAAPSSHLDSFQPIVSVSASESFVLDNGVRVTPGMKLAYSHELLDTSATLALTTPAGSLVPGTALTPARDTLTIGPEVTAAMTQQLSLYADYQAVIGIGKSLGNIVFAGARWLF